MGFKLGSESRKINEPNFKNRFNSDDVSVPGVPVIRTELDKGILGEANIDGSIFLDNSVEPGSPEERAILQHEMKHIVDMKTGKLSYTDDTLTWMGEDFQRQDGMINYNGTWMPEGSKDFPWEKH